MQENYSHKKVEQTVQKYWEDNKTFKVTENSKKEKYYCLSMFPYPSGYLHIGHIRNYTIGDVIARYHRMLGKNVLHPIGWDALGLPAERASILNNIHPNIWTYSNINNMRKQLKLFGFSYDWDREIITCDPKYYRWEQWFFIYLYKNGLAYKKKSLVNWCPQDKTVLANEQVINGRCWRCETKIEYKNISQWFIKITQYADELLYNLKELKHWPEKVKEMQKNWIGKSEGMEITLKILNSNDTITIYTTRPDTIMGSTYIILAANHPISLNIAKYNPRLSDFVKKCRLTKVSESDIASIEKIGIETGLYAVHPLNNEILPIWIVNFMLMNYSTGAAMAVPAHNQQDLEFANKYHLPIKIVVLNSDGSKPDITTKAMTKTGILFNSGQFNGLNFKASFNAIAQVLEDLCIGKRKISYRLRDWSISRQRYWGVPIPMLTLKNGKTLPVSEEYLPITISQNRRKLNIYGIFLSKDNSIEYHDKNNILMETDTFDTFIESSWYYARYTCPNYHLGMIDSNSANYWLPIDQYIGGIEHATMHLIYFRFYHKLMRDAGFVKSDEPAKKLLCQGMVLSDTFYYLSNGEKIWVSPKNVNIIRDKNGKIVTATDFEGNTLIYDGMKKMSKSRNNGISPQEIVEQYGADTVRLFIMFAAPVEMALEWKESGLNGAQRFLKRVWNLTYKHKKNIRKDDNLDISLMNNKQKILRHEVYKTVIKVTDDIEKRQSFNTAISSIMKLVNKLDQAPQKTTQDRALLQESLIIVIKMLYPFAPHICFFLWKELVGQESIDNTYWPSIDQSAIMDTDKLIIIQINGKLRGKIFVSKNANKQSVISLAHQENSVSKFLQNSTIDKVIYLPGRLINFVLK